VNDSGAALQLQGCAFVIDATDAKLYYFRQDEYWLDKADKL